jgi:cell division transport system permease protein
VVGFLVEEAARDLRRAGRMAAGAVLLLTMAVVAAGAVWFLSVNLGRALAEWRDRVRMIVYLKDEASSPVALQASVQAIPGVTSVRYVSKADALAALRQALGREASVADQLSANPLPASLEITPSPEGATPEGARALMATLAGLPEAEEVAGGTAWVDRLARWRRLLQGLSLAVGAALAVAAVLTVTTATTLVLHARRHEIEIMRLVGATEVAIRGPLILQGSAQGLLGALLAIGILLASHRLLAPHVAPLMAAALGVSDLRFFTPVVLGGLVLVGTLLGGLGGILARAPREARG